MKMHSHHVHESCFPGCPAYDDNAWRCGECGEMRPMMADTEDWTEPLCDECYLRLPLLKLRHPGWTGRVKL